MPDTRRHRGPHPEDKSIFGADQVSTLRQATMELSWLLTREYAGSAALKLVGDRHQLVQRQRTAVMRCACSDQSLQNRRNRRVRTDQLTDAVLSIDGFNLLTSVEAALAGGVLIRGRDGCIRDMASMHGTWRRVEETNRALRMIGECLHACSIRQAHWLLDRPVSNSGRLQAIMREVAADDGWPWTVELHDNPDRELMAVDGSIVISADRVVIENSSAWYPLAGEVITQASVGEWLVDLSEGSVL